MELKHHFSVPATVDTTWATFMDLAGVAVCFPGATVTAADGDRFEGTCKVKLGPIALLYTGSGTFVERDDAAHHAVIQADGKDKRGNGTAGATVIISLAESADAGTDVDVTTDLAVTGKPAQFGRGVMQDVSDKLLGQFVACLEQRFAAGVEGPAGIESTESTESTVEPAPEPHPEPEAEKETTPAAAPKPAHAPAGRNVDQPAFTPSGRGDDDALDLGSTVLPVLLRTYAPQLVAGVVGLVVGVLIGRGRRR